MVSSAPARPDAATAEGLIGAPTPAGNRVENLLAGTNLRRAGGTNDAMDPELATPEGNEGRTDEFARKGGAALAIGATAGGVKGTDDGRERAVGLTICGAAGGWAAISNRVTDSD